MSRFIWLLMFAGFVTASGCGQKPADRTPGKVTSDDVRRDAGQAVDTASEFSQQTKAEFQKKLDARIQELDAEIAKLQEKGGDLQDEAKATWEQKMAELETKRDAARTRLTEVRQSSGEAWKDIQKGAQSAWDNLDKAASDAKAEFESPAKSK